MNFLEQDLRPQIVEEVAYLRRFARALTNDPVISDDLVQDCIERALSRLHLFDQSRSLRTWLFTILRNLYINELRKHKQRGVHASIDEVAEHDLAQLPNQSEDIVGLDITKSLKQLPDNQREVLVLVGLEQMSYEETARIIDVPVGTVMSRLSRARAQLRVIMGEDDAKKGK